MDLTPGSTVEVEVQKTPQKDAARKTLVRVFSKDPDVAHAIRRRREQRPSVSTKQRGGRVWTHRMKSRPPVDLSPGQRYKVRATVDVIRDLESVERWIKVTSA